MKPIHKYCIFIFCIAFAIFGVIFASVLCSWLNLPPKGQALLLDLIDSIIPFPILGAFVLLLIIGFMVSLLFRYYIIPIMRIAESAQLITLANQNHRVPEEGAHEVKHLARILNASADAYQKLRHEVETIIFEARADLLEERNRFAVLMSELPVGVLVCNLNGQILLYNKKAKSLFNSELPEKSFFCEGGDCFIGLGRSVFSIIPRDKVTSCMNQLQLDVAAGDSEPISRFTVDLITDCSLSISMSPVFSFHCEQHEECFQCERRRISGFILTLDDKPFEKEMPKNDEMLDCVHLSEQARVRVPDADFHPDWNGSSLKLGSRPVYYDFNLFHYSTPDKLGDEPLRKLVYVVFDTETTGLDPANGDEIIQLGAVRVVNGKIVPEEMIDQLVDPKRSIPEESVAIHGITSKMVVNQPTIDKLLPYFYRFAEGSVLVAHNASFDMRCLQLQEKRSGVKFENPVLDTLLLSSIVHPQQHSHSLDEIAARLNLNNIGRHTALGDALVTAEVFIKLIPLLEAKGIFTLNDSLKASIYSPYARLSY